MEQVIHLFQGIQPDEIARMMVCFQAVEKRYLPGEYICSYGENNTKIGVIMEGSVQILRTHEDGRQTILEHLKPGGVFGETLSFISQATCTLQVYSIEKTKIIYIEYAHLIKRCSKACSFHSQIVNNTLQIISHKAVQLSERLEVLSQRTTREKLMCYFAIQSAHHHSASFTLPFSLSTLADYLSVDRSAMMREIKKMKDEKLIQTERQKIVLLDQVM